jgi:hypothetical protein
MDGQLFKLGARNRIYIDVVLVSIPSFYALWSSLVGQGKMGGGGQEHFLEWLFSKELSELALVSIEAAT